MKSAIPRMLWLAFLMLLISSCTLFDREERQRELLPVRNVKAVPFPVRPLEFDETRIRQEKDQLHISGVIENISYSPVKNVTIQAIVYLAEDQTDRTLLMPVIPRILQPGDKGEFTVLGIVEQPVSHVELHVQWEPYYPPGL